MIAFVKKIRLYSVVLAVPLGGVGGCTEITAGGGNVGGPSTERSCSTDTACTFDGIPNRSLGGAKLSLNEESNLIVESSGSDGVHGVRQFGIPNDTVVMTTGIACPNFVESVAGSKLEIIMYGDIPGEILSTVTVENIDGESIIAETDFSPVGVTLYTVQIMNGDELVLEVTDLPSSQVQVQAGNDWVAYRCGLHPNNPPETQMWTDWALTQDGVIILVPSGQSAQGNIVRVTGQDQKLFPTVLTSFDNFFTLLPKVEMTFQETKSFFEEEPLRVVR